MPHERPKWGFKEWTASPPFFLEDNVTGNTSMGRQWGRRERCQRRRAGRAAPTGRARAPGHPEPVCAPGLLRARAELGIPHRLLPLLRGDGAEEQGRDGRNCSPVPTGLSGTGDTQPWGGCGQGELSPPGSPAAPLCFSWRGTPASGGPGLGEVHPYTG